MTEVTINGQTVRVLPVIRCGNCAGPRPHHAGTGWTVCAACGWVRDETEVKGD